MRKSRVTDSGLEGKDGNSFGERYLWQVIMDDDAKIKCCKLEDLWNG